jgi:hypothetical protein
MECNEKKFQRWEQIIIFIGMGLAVRLNGSTVLGRKFIRIPPKNPQIPNFYFLNCWFFETVESIDVLLDYTVIPLAGKADQ